MQLTGMEFLSQVFMMFGKTIAETMQEKSSEMTPTEIVEKENFYPIFDPTKQYLDHKIGYVCRSPTGNLVRLIQPYDSLIYQAPPEELPAQWGFLWTTDPAYAKPFVESATSPYNTGDCCTYNGHVWKSGMDRNTWPPGTEGVIWEDLGPEN